MSTVTAIVSAYYAEEYLEGRIINLLEQSKRPQIIIVAKYDSEEFKIAQKYRSKDVMLIKTTSIPTVYSAWNIAISFSTADYITNANCDDRLYPGAIAELARRLDDNPDCAIAYSYVDIVREIGGAPVGRYEFADGGMTELRRECFMGPMPMWRRSLHTVYGDFDSIMKVAGDYEFWLRCVFYGEKTLPIKQALGAYKANADGRENREPMLTIWETARARARYHDGNSGYLQEAGYAQKPEPKPGKAKKGGKSLPLPLPQPSVTS